MCETVCDCVCVTPSCHLALGSSLASSVTRTADSAMCGRTTVVELRLAVEADPDDDVRSLPVTRGMPWRCALADCVGSSLAGGSEFLSLFPHGKLMFLWI